MCGIQQAQSKKQFNNMMQISTLKFLFHPPPPSLKAHSRLDIHTYRQQCPHKNGKTYDQSCATTAWLTTFKLVLHFYQLLFTGVALLSGITAYLVTLRPAVQTCWVECLSHYHQAQHVQGSSKKKKLIWLWCLDGKNIETIIWKQQQQNKNQET